MSLLGNLEDLGLGDILQIVSLSKKSGVLRLKDSGREGRILFRDGKVVGATVSTIQVNLIDLLLKTGLVGSDAAKEADKAWNASGQQIPFQKILIEQYHVAPALIEDTIREHIQQVVSELFSWIDGEFNFELQDIAEEVRNLEPAKRELISTDGISPQFLAIEALRIIDERNSTEGVPSISPRSSSVAPDAREDVRGEQPPELGRVIPLKRTPPPAPASPRPTLKQETTAPAALAESPVVVTPVVSVPKPLSTPVVVVDDDKITLNAISQGLRLLGFQPHPADTVDGAKALIGEFEVRHQFYVVVADLLMPRSDGAGILGGLELIEFEKTLSHFRPTAIISDYENDAAQKKALQLGVSQILRKPKKGDLAKGVQSEALGKFMQSLAPLLADWIQKETGEVWEPLTKIPQGKVPSAGPSSLESMIAENNAEQPIAVEVTTPSHLGETPDTGKTRDIGGEIAEEIGADFKPVAKSHSAGLSMLRQMSQELNNPESNIEITLLVLRFAAELMTRAVIFLVTDKEIRGLGQFGLEIPGANPTRVVRTTVIPLRDNSVLSDVAMSKNTFKGPVPPSKWNHYLLNQFGGFQTPEVFVAPIVSRNRCVALLYGDNAGPGTPIGDTEALEIFLVQAGMAMDRAILERRLGELAKALPRDRS